MELSSMTAMKLKELISSGETCSRDIMESVLNEIDRRESSVKAYITVRDRKELLDEAEKIDARRERGEAVGVLDGLPIAIKDNICTEGIPTTCASRMLADFVPPYNATVVEKILDADGIVIGKTNLDEFSMGSSTENSIIGPTMNPHNPDYVSGGTSGGSAAAVAANECIIAIGSDTGGSIRQPASFCGVTGIKPTYGRVSRYGLVAYASSLDQIGVLSKDVSDAALLMGVIAGHDPRDTTSINKDTPDYLSGLGSKQTYRVGVPKEYFEEGLNDEVRESVERVIDLLKNDGHSIVQVSLPKTHYAVAAYYIIACAEASSNLARYDGVRYTFRAEGVNDLDDMYLNTRAEAFGEEVKRRIILGTYVLSSGYYDAYYLKASRVRSAIIEEYNSAFETSDFLIHPVAPTAAFRIGEKINDPLEMYLSDIYSTIANLTGTPAISISCGKTGEGLPIGVQIAARPLDEEILLSAASRIESLLAGNNPL
ncbi:MAG: Asp-tRNA(Asn)/Glu-tRNA(Gln) amidotransferase subunit GatA [Nitrospirota bacterium]